jgi:excisionase family DNA binding protein
MSDEEVVAPRVAYTIDEMCAAFGGVSREWLYTQLRAGRIKSVKIGGRRFIAASEFDRIAKGDA